MIYCSLPTANLVNLKLGVDKKFLHPLGMNTPTVIGSKGKPVTVTLLDANHCPGAVMFLFQVGKRRILHVGDFRWNKDFMLQHSPLRSIALRQSQLDDIFLDTTYCNDKYALPTQEETILATVELAEKEVARCRRQKLRLLMLFGAYTIGKEKIFLSVAERLGMKVYVDRDRYRTLAALEWPKDRFALLTTDSSETCIWVVPLGHINFKRMATYVKGSDKVFAKRRHDRVVGFRPTGWTMTAKSKSGIISSRTNGILTVHGIPYSEHSSFPELVECIDCLKPKRIIPTVSVSTSEQQVALLLNALKRRGLEGTGTC